MPGPARWPRAVDVSCGPELRRLRARGRVVRVPVDGRLEITGLTADPLPKKVAVAGRSLAALLLPAGTPSPWRPAASSRSHPAEEGR